MTHVFLARACRDSYRPGGIPHAQEIGSLGVKCFVLHLEPKVLIFRGTSDKAGWLQDILARKVGALHPELGQVHRGFREGWEAIAQQVRRAIRRKPVVIAGHSLGGALATLAALELDTREVVTFGSPRVGDGQFAAAYRKRLGKITTRYVNATDKIPLFPFCNMSYRHVVPARWWLDGAFRAPNPWVWALSFLRRLARGQESLWADHSIDSYVAIAGKGGKQ